MKNSPSAYARMIIPLLCCIVLLIALGTSFLSNTGRLIASRGYFIPNESSIFTFEPTVENEGSGEWWIYGEDFTYYYYAGVHPYLKIKKTNNCPSFSEEDYTTWCSGNAPGT